MKIKKLISIFITTLIFLSIIATCGCAQLGDYGLPESTEDNEDNLNSYYESYDNVIIVDEDCEESELQLKSLYNRTTQNEFKKSDFNCEMENNKYRYVVVKTKKAMRYDSFAFWIKTPTDADMIFVSYLFDDFDLDFLSKDETKDYDIIVGKYKFTKNYRQSGKIITKTCELWFDGKGQVTIIYDPDGDGTNETYVKDYVLNETYRTTYFEVEYSAVIDNKEQKFTDKFDCTLSEDYNSVKVVYFDGVEELQETRRFYFYKDFDSNGEGFENALASKKIEQKFKKDEWDSVIFDSWDRNDEESLDLDEYMLKAGAYIVIQIKNNGFASKRYKLTKIPFVTTNIMMRGIVTK